jgi:hypothetical protein
MDRERLQALLASLQRELRDARSLDAESRRMLATAMNDISRTLAAPADLAASPAVSSRLDDLVVRFESDHPALAGALRQLIDALAKAGI